MKVLYKAWNFPLNAAWLAELAPLAIGRDGPHVEGSGLVGVLHLDFDRGSLISYFSQ